jgi:hypothetical protein
MRLVVPYVPGKLNPYVPLVLKSYGFAPVFVELNGEHGYSDLLKRLWANLETVVVIEQDVLPWPGAVEELHSCIGEWCTCSYRYGGGYGLSHMLGCAKLSIALMKKLPGLWDKPVPWARCDAHLYYAAREVGQEPHPHRPPVVHLSPREMAA